ncbi:MAG: hypothetical protein PHF37_10415 [Phycisphaerae bacterium]|nr:hypothetical protein [Phycisphaerae bacterium]
MAKRRSGLHKEISSIFDGIPHPAKERGEGTFAPSENPRSASNRKSFIPDLPRADVPLEQKSRQTPPKAAPPRPIQPARPKQTSSGENGDFLKFLQPIVTKIFVAKEGVDPKKHIIKIIAVPLLFVVFIVMFANALNLGGSDSPAVQGSQATVNMAATGLRLTPIAIKWKIPEVYSATLLDPMQMQRSRQADVDTQSNYVLQVTAIVISEEKRLALLRTGQIVKEGEEINGIKFIKVNKDSVELEQDGKKWIQKVEK